MSVKRLDRFILTYPGNKYLECKKHLHIPNKNYNYIVEPFGGIFGFSRSFYEKNENFNGKFLINDINKDMIDFYKNLQLDFSKTADDVYTHIDNICCDCMSDKEFTQKIRLENYIIKLICQANNINVFKRKIANNKCFNFICKKNIYVDFLQKCEFFCMDYNEFLNMVDSMTGKKLIFFDPPYFLSDNSSYITTAVNGVRQDCSKIYIDILKYFENSENNIYFIINYSCLMDYIFNKYFYKKYEKCYGSCKNKAEHIIYRKIH